MKRAWTLAAFAIAVMGIGAVVACDGNGTKDLLRSAAASTALAQEQPGRQGCSVIGNWSTDSVFGPGNSYVQWMTTITGQSSSGEMTTETPVWPNLPWVARVTLRGAWERTGSNTFSFKQIGFMPGPDGTTYAMAKNVGTQTVTDDCMKLRVESKMQIFELTGALYAEQDLPAMIAYRIVVPD